MISFLRFLEQPPSFVLQSLEIIFIESGDPTLRNPRDGVSHMGDIQIAFFVTHRKVPEASGYGLTILVLSTSWLDIEKGTVRQVVDKGAAPFGFVNINVVIDIINIHHIPARPHGFFELLVHSPARRPCRRHPGRS